MEAGVMSNLLDFVPNSGAGAGKFRLKAGGAIAQDDGVQLGPDGQAWPVKVTDYAVVANAGSSVVAATSVIATYSWPYTRNPLYRDPATGNLFCVTPNATGANPGYGCRVTKYSPAGLLLGSVVLSASGGEQLYSPKIRLLANGNLVVTWNPNASADYRFAVIDTSLNVIKAATSIDTPSDQFNDVVALSGGGFMVAYRKAGGLQRIAVYDNAGNVVTASATVQTWTGAANAVLSKLVQLSNGNVALVCTSSYTTTLGTYFGIFTAAGAVVLAMANVDAAAWNNTVQPEALAVNGYFAFAYANASNTVVLRVYSDAGALQGAALSTVVAASGASTNCFKLLTDGTQFFLLLQHATSLWWTLTKMPLAGVGSTTYAAGTFTNAGGQLVIDAFIENERLVAIHSQSSAAPSAGFFVMNLVSFTVETATTGLGWDGLYTAVVASDDFTFAAFYDTSASPGNYFRVVKYANSAIMGVALAAAAAGGPVSIGGGAGAYVTNQLKGTASKQFDHSATNIYGNKGALMSNGAVLKGF
jgi:hypothetical protein